MKNLFNSNKCNKILVLFIFVSTMLFSFTVKNCHAKKNSTGKIYNDSADFAPIEMKERVYKKTGKEWSEFTDEERASYIEQWAEYQAKKKKEKVKKEKSEARTARNSERNERNKARAEKNKIKNKERAAKNKAKAEARKKKNFQKKIKNQKKKMKNIRKRNSRR